MQKDDTQKVSSFFVLLFLEQSCRFCFWFRL